LILEEIKLHLWIVELCVGIDELVVIAEKLEALNEAGLRSVPFSEGRHDLRVIDQEGRVFAVNLNKVANELIDQS
jgi:hypothetical protein